MVIVYVAEEWKKQCFLFVDVIFYGVQLEEYLQPIRELCNIMKEMVGPQVVKSKVMNLVDRVPVILAQLEVRNKFAICVCVVHK